MFKISDTYFNFNQGIFEKRGEKYLKVKKTLKDLNDFFLTKKNVNLDEIIYKVEGVIHEEKEGQLNFGVTTVYSGTINEEFYMTKGHYHKNLFNAEYYWGIKGKGLLLMCDKSGNYSLEKVEKNSLHYILGEKAHRLINISSENLVVGACWASNSGHNYQEIIRKGFPVRIFKNKDTFEIIKVKN